MKKTYIIILFILQQIAFAQCEEPGENAGDTSCISLIYGGIEQTYSTVRGADGKIWLQQNLGSNSVATSQTDQDAYGDLFQWGRWDDGHQARNSATSSSNPTPNNPLGLNGGDDLFYISNPDWWKSGITSDKWEAEFPSSVTANNGCDPCKALGDGWQLPTSEEWQTIVNAENITNIASAFESNLKLTIAGSRGDSGISNAGVRGYYWSKTTSDNPDFAKYLYYSNFIVNTTAGGFREQGSSVRCVKSAAVYCAVGVDHGVEPISLVVFADIQNETSPAVNATPAFENFTSQIAHVNKGETYSLTVKGNTVGFEHDIRVFIDWNQNKVFDMDSEYYTVSLAQSNGADAIEAVLDIQIPDDANLGTTRMRIIKDMWNVYEEGEIDACLNAYYGQVEEYSVNIQESLNVNENLSKNFKIHPNPTTDFVTIESKSEIESVALYNQLGQLIKTQKELRVNLSNSASGIYFIKIKFENGETTTQKIIKK